MCKESQQIHVRLRNFTEFVDGNGGSSVETTTLGYDNTTITTTAAGDKPLYFCCYRPLYSTFVLGAVLFFPLMILLRFCWMKYRDNSQRRQRSMLMRRLDHQQNQHCCNNSSPSIYTIESRKLHLLIYESAVAQW